MQIFQVFLDDEALFLREMIVRGIGAIAGFSCSCAKTGWLGAKLTRIEKQEIAKYRLLRIADCP